MAWDSKNYGYENAMFVLRVYWPERHTPNGRVTVKRAIAQARACTRKRLNRPRRPKPRDPGNRREKRRRPIRRN